MKTAHVMLALLCLLPAMIAGCETRQPRPLPESFLASPYEARPVVWAVAPLVNESGVGVVDELAITDTLVNEIQKVQGLTALPTNRTLAAMRALRLDEIRTPTDARAVSRILGADAIVVGSVTTWDPYQPPRLGLLLDLYARTGVVGAVDIAEIDPNDLRLASTDADLSADTYRQLPVSSYAALLDASSGEVVEAVELFAHGRHDPNSPLGWRLYLKSMTRFTEFACFQAVRGLLGEESTRIAAAGASLEEPR